MNKKLFRGAILETILLNLINNAQEEGLHGYAIFSVVRKKFGIRLGPSVLYSELKTLEKQGLVESRWTLVSGKVRRIFFITLKGKYQLNEYSVQLQAVIPQLGYHARIVP